MKTIKLIILVLATIKADSPEEIAQALELMFTNPEAKQKQIANQIKYLQDNTWDKIGLQYAALFEK
jgi:glycosyltransferase involved in cell wall biosynthesis